MSAIRKYASAIEYWHSIEQGLDNHVSRERATDVEACICGALALYSFGFEHLTDEATRHAVLLPKIGMPLVVVQDALRGACAAQRELSPVAAACLARAILENRCNLLFIYKSDDPAKWADRYLRYADVERVLHDEQRGKDLPARLTAAERADFLKRVPEWVRPNGRIHPKHWTAEDEYTSLAALARQVGLAAEYHGIYAVASKYMHGSPLLAHGYSTGTSVGALANSSRCSEMTLMAAHFGVELMKETVAFFAAPSLDRDYLEWQPLWRRCAESLRSSA